MTEIEPVKIEKDTQQLYEKAAGGHEARTPERNAASISASKHADSAGIHGNHHGCGGWGPTSLPPSSERLSVRVSA